MLSRSGQTIASLSNLNALWYDTSLHLNILIYVYLYEYNR